MTERPESERRRIDRKTAVVLTILVAIVVLVAAFWLLLPLKFV